MPSSPDNGQTPSRRFFHPASALFNRNAHLRLWLIASTGLAADLWTKCWALKTIGNPAEIRSYDLKPINLIDGTLRLITVLNPGASWGIAAGQTTLLLAGSAVALIFMFWLFISLRANQWVAQIALAMLLGGALGNTYDRIFNNGMVVDFIDIDLGIWPANPWPAFNIADSLLCTGVAILLISMLIKPKKIS